VGNEFDLTAVEMFEEFLGYPKTSGGIRHRSALEANKNVMMVVHYDFICALLDAVVAPETRGAFARWRHHNTAITVIDVTAKDGEVIFVAQNAVSHVTDPALLSGFPL
jgi:broad specificity phosphatase PhoE